MIPKTIHCCWFGGPKTALAERCRRSWALQAPGWDVREWDVAQAKALKDLPGYGFFKDAIAARRWAMASDWLRMAALWREGGVYLDYDVELVAGLDGLCEDGAWVASEWTVSGATWMNPGSGIALEKNSPVARTMLEAYGRVVFDAGRKMMPFINERLQEAMRTSGGLLRILPPEVMSPIGTDGKIRRTAATCAIHRYAMSDSGWTRRLARWLAWHGMGGILKFLRMFVIGPGLLRFVL